MKKLEATEEPEQEQEDGNETAVMVKSSGTVINGSDASGALGATGTLSSERPVTHHLSRTLGNTKGPLV